MELRDALAFDQVYAESIVSNTKQVTNIQSREQHKTSCKHPKSESEKNGCVREVTSNVSGCGCGVSGGCHFLCKRELPRITFRYRADMHGCTPTATAPQQVDVVEASKGIADSDHIGERRCRTFHGLIFHGISLGLCGHARCG